MLKQKRAKTILCAVMTLLSSLLVMAGNPVLARDISAQEIIVRGISVPQAVGMGMAGATFEHPKIQVSFAYKPGTSDFLLANGGQLAQVKLLEYGDELLKGTLTYTNDLGQNAYYGYVIDYETVAPDNYQVKGTEITPFEPMAPRAEAYFVPAAKMGIKDMKAMPVADLLRFARTNTDYVKAGAPAGPVKEYVVLAFCMDRLMKGSEWAMFSTGGMGESWSEGDWRVAAMDAVLAMNDPKAQVFQIYMKRGPGSVDAGKTLQVGVFSNQHLPSMPPGPVAQVQTTPALSDLLNRYKAKAQPDIKE